LLHRTNANVRRAQAERLPATTAIVDWYTSSRWSPLKMTATKVRMAHQAVPYRHDGGRSKGKPFVAVTVGNTRGTDQRGNSLWLSPCSNTRGTDQRGNPLWLSPCSGHKGGRSKRKLFVAVAVSQEPRCVGSRWRDHHRCSLEGDGVGRPKVDFGTAHHSRQGRFRKDKVKTL